MIKTKIPKVSIGLPVYNGEEFIVKKIESILSQTFKDFELIISDNNSTDKTAEICKKFELIDKRIKFLVQKKNIGAAANFNFVLDKANGKYFLWSAVDDFLLATFLEKNINVLETKKNIAGSISKISLYGEKTNSLIIKSNDSIFQKIMKKVEKRMGYMDTFPATGSYEKRIKEYFKNLRHNQIFYGIFRTDQIKKAHVRNSFLMVDACTILNILKFGELFVIDEILMKTYDGGVSRQGMLAVTKHVNYKIMSKIFPNSHFTFWCYRNLDFKIFLNSLGFFVKINFIGAFSLSIDLLRKLKLVNSVK